jgi:hypothetical protein
MIYVLYYNEELDIVAEGSSNREENLPSNGAGYIEVAEEDLGYVLKQERVDGEIIPIRLEPKPPAPVESLSDKLDSLLLQITEIKERINNLE